MCGDNILGNNQEMKELNTNKNLVASNKFIRGRHKLSKEEQNFIYLIISQINKDDTKFTEYQIHISKLENLEQSQKKYGRYIDFAIKLQSKVIVIEDERQILTLNWFSSLRYTKGTGVITAKISDDLKPYLLELKKEFVKAELPTLLSFISKYASRLFLLLKSDFDRQKKHKPFFSVKYQINYLHTNFAMPKSYLERYSKFKDIFLNKSINEINEKTELNVSYKEIKTGRKITEIEFCISSKVKEEKKEIEKNNFIESPRPTKLRSKINPSLKPSNIKPLSRELLGLDPTENLNSNLRNLLSDFNKDHQDILINDCKLKEKDIRAILKKYDVDSLIEICDVIYNKYEKIKNHQAFFRSQLKFLDEYFYS